jgi:hypothetical protein
VIARVNAQIAHEPSSAPLPPIDIPRDRVPVARMAALQHIPLGRRAVTATSRRKSAPRSYARSRMPATAIVWRSCAVCRVIREDGSSAAIAGACLVRCSSVRRRRAPGAQLFLPLSTGRGEMRVGSLCRR